jgi:tRNA threonylcarbamoyl adenosine modification protein YeaZ
MKILALELSSALGSIAFVDEDRIPVVREFPSDRKHSGLFFESLRDIYRAEEPPNRIVVGLGPGSYAGVRIAIAAALGLKAAGTAKLIGLPSICAFAQTMDEYRIIGDARRESFFFARVKGGECVDGPTLYSANDLRARLNEQPGISLYCSQSLPQFEGAVLAYPSALVLAQLGRTRPADIGDEMRLQPIYLRDPHITIPAKTASLITNLK